MSDLISLDEVRKARRPQYTDVATLEVGCELIEGCVSQMVVGSQNEFGGIDPLAHEINAHVVAIRRALATADLEAEDH